MSDDRLNKIERLLDRLSQKLDKLDEKVEDLLWEDETPGGRSDDRPITSDEDIYKHGQKIGYNKLEGDEVWPFKDFIRYIRNHENEFNSKEFDYAGFADKNFSDARISDNMRRILGNAYQKLYRKPMPFNFIRGYMYKFQGQIAWEWSDGTRD